MEHRNIDKFDCLKYRTSICRKEGRQGGRKEKRRKREREGERMEGTTESKDKFQTGKNIFCMATDRANVLHM